jgi:hypothetical protein
LGAVGDAPLQFAEVVDRRFAPLPQLAVQLAELPFPFAQRGFGLGSVAQLCQDLLQYPAKLVSHGLLGTTSVPRAGDGQCFFLVRALHRPY